MNFDQFFEEAKRLNVKIKFDNEEMKTPPLLSNEALFHLPFLAMTILILAKGSRKPKMNELGQVVGECLELSLKGFKGSSQHIGWSANLRIRTIRALSFVELANLAIVDQRSKVISLTDLGRKVIDKALKEQTNLSETLQVIGRSYRNIAVERQMEMELI